MQGTKVVVWVLAVSLAATALMFGASSLMQARGSGSGSDVAGDGAGADDTVQRRYVRLCDRNQWAGKIDLAESVVATVRYMELQDDGARALTRAFLMEQLGIQRVLEGDSWSEIRAGWRGVLFHDLHLPTRRELAETTERCVRNLSSEARRWIAAAR